MKNDSSAPATATSRFKCAFARPSAEPHPNIIYDAISALRPIRNAAE
jgi:hypothetical protein